MLLDRDVSDGELSESDFDSIMDRLADLSATGFAFNIPSAANEECFTDSRCIVNSNMF